MAEIAVAAATAVLRNAIGVLGNLVVQEGSRLSRLQEQIIWIESEMRHIQSYLQDAEANQGGSRGVADLMIDITDLSCDVEDIMAAYFPKIASHQRNKGFSGCLRSATCISCHSYAAHNFVTEIEGIRRRVENINRVRQTYGINVDTDRGGRDIWDARRSYPHVDEPNVVGFDEHIQKLKAILLRRELRYHVISIVGMPGLGKTTLAKKVFKSVTTPMANDSSECCFECSAWVYVSQVPNVKELLCNIAKQVGLEKEKWEENVEANLFSFLSEKRYVIVLDDIWDNQTWNALRISIPNNSNNGSRIIVTSRNRDVGLYIGGHSSLHELLPLNPNDSWQLFSKMLVHPSEYTDDTSPSPRLQSIGRKIVERCAGVPLAIVVTAGLLLLRDRTEHAWRQVLKGMGQGQDECLQILALSYKDLPTCLKPCFLYFGLFHEDQEIFVDDLIYLWMAEGFIQASGVQEFEDVGEDYLNHLIARNLIQVGSRRFDGRVRSCRIHDLLHCLCISEARKSNFFHASIDITANSAMGVRRVTIHSASATEFISLNYPTPKLRAMISLSPRDRLMELKRKHFKSVVRNFRVLRVLSLEWLKLPRVLPKEIGFLIHLSYLRLAGHDSTEVPSTISNLKNLQTLDLRRRRVEDINHYLIIPNVIWKMKQLRHILLSHPTLTSFKGNCGLFKMDRFHPIEISLPNLQTLYVVNGDYLEADWLPKFSNLRKLGIGYATEQIIEVLSDATPISHKLENLRLRWSGLMEAHMKLNLSRYQNLCKLHLSGSMRELPEHDKLPPNLIKLTLYVNMLQNDPMQTLKRLPQLKILKLGSNFDERRSMVYFVGGALDFPQLETLEIKYLRNLELIVEGGGIPRLKKLKIVECNLIMRIPDRIKNIMMRTR